MYLGKESNDISTRGVVFGVLLTLLSGLEGKATCGRMRSPRLQLEGLVQNLHCCEPEVSYHTVHIFIVHNKVLSNTEHIHSYI